MAMAGAMPRTLIALRSFNTTFHRGLQTAAAPTAAAIEPLRLTNIRDNHGARKRAVRLGRGRGSGCGKTSGRGQKGQKARNSVRLGFEGGQTPLAKRKKKVRNYYDPHARPLESVTVGRLQRAIDLGHLDPEKPVTMRELFRSGVVTRIRYGVALAPGGSLASPLKIQVTEASPEAAMAVLDAGGMVELAWYSRIGLRALLKPRKWTDNNLPLPRWAAPPPKWQHRYPERSETGVPVRPLRSPEDIEQIREAWKRVIRPRHTKASL